MMSIGWQNGWAITLYDDAEEYYIKAISLVKQVFSEDSPNLAQLYLDYANCLLGKGNYSEAICNIKALNQFTENDTLLERVMEHKLGTCYYLLTNYSEAVNHLQKAAELCRQNENGKTDIGYIAVDLYFACRGMNELDLAEEYKQIALATVRQYYDDVELSAYVHNLEINLAEK